MGQAKKQIRKKPERFVGIPYNVANSHHFGMLEAREVKLLLDLLIQRNGRNNGCLSPCHSLMKKRGWAPSSLYRAFTGLIKKGFVVVTRQGWKVRGKPTLIALTWDGIDEPVQGVEYDDHIKISHIPLNYWCKHPETWRDNNKTTSP